MWHMHNAIFGMLKIGQTTLHLISAWYAHFQHPTLISYYRTNCGSHCVVNVFLRPWPKQRSNRRERTHWIFSWRRASSSRNWKMTKDIVWFFLFCGLFLGVKNQAVALKINFDMPRYQQSFLWDQNGWIATEQWRKNVICSDHATLILQFLCILDHRNHCFYL